MTVNLLRSDLGQLRSVAGGPSSALNSLDGLEQTKEPPTRCGAVQNKRTAWWTLGGLLWPINTSNQVLSRIDNSVVSK